MFFKLIQATTSSSQSKLVSLSRNIALRALPLVFLSFFVRVMIQLYSSASATTLKIIKISKNGTDKYKLISLHHFFHVFASFCESDDFGCFLSFSVRAQCAKTCQQFALLWESKFPGLQLQTRRAQPCRRGSPSLLSHRLCIVCAHSQTLIHKSIRSHSFSIQHTQLPSCDRS